MIAPARLTPAYRQSNLSGSSENKKLRLRGGLGEGGAAQVGVRQGSRAELDGTMVVVVRGEQQVDEVRIAGGAAVGHVLEPSVEDKRVDALRKREQSSVLELPQSIDEPRRGQLADAEMLVLFGQTIPVHASLEDVGSSVVRWANREEPLSVGSGGLADRYVACSCLAGEDRARFLVERIAR